MLHLSLPRRGPRRRKTSLLLLVLLLLGPGLLRAERESPEAVRRRARAVLSRERFQDVLDARRDGEAGSRAPRPGEGDAPLPAESARHLFPPYVSRIARVLSYLLLGVIVLLVGVWLFKALRDGGTGRRGARRLRGKAAAEETGWIKEPAATSRTAAGELLASADRHARQGRLDEAVHVLLLGAIEHLSRVTDSLQKPSSTSREIVERVSLDGSRRHALEELVLAVEMSLFGGKAISRETYESCRRRTHVILRGDGS